jgi:hypothetical protein
VKVKSFRWRRQKGALIATRHRIMGPVPNYETDRNQSTEKQTSGTRHENWSNKEKIVDIRRQTTTGDLRGGVHLPLTVSGDFERMVGKEQCPQRNRKQSFFRAILLQIVVSSDHFIPGRHSTAVLWICFPFFFSSHF